MVEMTAQDWYWIRHAPVPQVKTVLYGSTDFDADVSQVISGMLSAVLPNEALHISSPMTRCLQTAAALGLAVDQHQPAFVEQRFGEWEGKTWDAINAEGMAKDFWQNVAHKAPPQGESFADVCHRVGAGIDATHHNPQPIVCVAHAGVIRAALGHALKIDPKQALSFHVENVSITHLRRYQSVSETSWAVQRVNWLQA